MPVTPEDPSTRWLRPARWLRRPRRFVLARRRGIAAVCAGLAVLLVLQSQATPRASTTGVLVAARDLPPGHIVGRADLRRAYFDPASVPDGVVARARVVTGRRTVGPIRRGEPLTDVRVLGPGLLSAHPGAVAVPVRLGDRAAARLLRVGDRVDILAADTSAVGAPGSAAAPDAVLVADDVPVLALPPDADAGSGLAGGALIVVAASETTARRLAGPGVSSYLTAVLVG